MIYPLIATPQGFREWWAADVIETPEGAELGFFNRTTIYRPARTGDQPPSHAQWRCDSGAEWSGTRIEFLLEPRGAGTFLRFSHADWAAETDYFLSCNTTWGELMFRLKAAEEGKTAGPLFLAAAMAY